MYNRKRKHFCVKNSVKNLGKYLKVQRTLLLSFMVISDVYAPFIPSKTTFIKYCLTQWISYLPGVVKIHWVRQYLVNFTGLAGKVNVTVYKTGPILTSLGHGELSLFLHRKEFIIIVENISDITLLFLGVCFIITAPIACSRDVGIIFLFKKISSHKIIGLPFNK